MIQTYQDGRVVLCKDQLKTLRRSLGASQEKVAFLCAERGLCVSISSLKRAETSKNVLYRTARDLARFYDVAVEQLRGFSEVSVDSDAPKSAEQDGHSTQTMAVQREFVLFCCEQSDLTTSTVVEAAGLESILGHIAPQYNAEFICCDKQRVYYSFGASHTHGNEAKRAISFAQRCQQIFFSLWGTREAVKLGLCVGKLTRSETDIEIDVSTIESSIDALMLSATPGILTMSDELLFAVDDHCSPISTELNSGSFWVINANDDSDTRDYSPIIGRRVEITLFNAVLESAKEYEALQVVHLVGSAGVGKSRLTEEFVRVASLDGFSCHTTNMTDFQVEQKKQTIPKLLKSLLGIDDSDSNLSLDEINSRNKTVILQETTHLPLLHSLLNWRISNRWESLFGAMSQEQLFKSQCQLITRILAIKARCSPLLIVIEDYHWSQNTERAYIDYLMNNLLGESVVLLITARPGETSGSVVLTSESSGASVTNISLGPLSRLDAQIFAEHISGIDADYREKCILKAQGNPLFLEQLLKDRRGSELGGLPYSLQSLIVSRIDDMPKEDQLAVRTASVIGQRFTLRLLRKLLNSPAYDPAALVANNIINGDDDNYSFNHALIVEGIYLSISAEDQRKLHYQCAQWYTDDIVLQCQHLLKGQHPEAIDKLIPAIKYLISGYHFERAKDFIDIALRLPGNRSAPLALHELRADVNLRVGDTMEALSSFEMMQRHAIAPEERANALIGKANCLNTLDKFDDAMQALNEAGDIASGSSLLKQLSSVYYLRGNFLFPKGQSRDCIESQEKALLFARKASEPELEARSLGGLGDAAYASGKMVTAYEYFKQCLALCDEHDLKAVSAANMFMLGTVRIYLNESEQGLADVERSITTAQMVGHKRAEIVSRLTASWILVESLRVIEAESHIALAMEIANEIGALRFVPFLRECKSRCLWLSGNADAAILSIEEALAEVEKLDAQAFIGPWVLGTCALLSKTRREAESYLDRAEPIIENGCVGHNYYRFYMEAIETTLNHGMYDRTKGYIEKFRNFANNEPCPWSDFYLKRGEVLLRSGDSADHKTNIEKLIRTAKSIQHLTAVPKLEQAMQKQQTEGLSLNS